MEILSELNKEYKIFVLSSGTDEDKAKLKAEGYQTIDIGSVVANPIKAIIFFYKLLKEVKNIQPFAILSFTIRPNIFGSLVARILSIPIISNVTGIGPLAEDDSILYNLIRQFYKYAFRKNKTIFFQNEDDLNFFLSNKYVQKYQSILIPGSGVDTNYFYPQIKTSKEFSFLMISRLIKDKGVIEYLEAAKIVKEKYPEIQFKLLGPYWTQSVGKNTLVPKDIESWIASNTIEYLGYTYDVRPAIANSNYLVLPSYREGCSNVLMQGASMEKPLIATDVTGCKNLIEDKLTGFLCRVKDIKNLSEQMIKLYELSEENRNLMGRKGREKMKNEYQKSIVIDAYKNALSNLIN